MTFIKGIDPDEDDYLMRQAEELAWAPAPYDAIEEHTHYFGPGLCLCGAVEPPALPVEALRAAIETIGEELRHYDLSDDPGYIRVPTERVRAILRARLGSEPSDG